MCYKKSDLKLTRIELKIQIMLNTKIFSFHMFGQLCLSIISIMISFYASFLGKPQKKKFIH